MTNDEKIIKEEELKKYVNSIIKNKNSEDDPNSPKKGTTNVDTNRERPNRALLPNVPKKNR